MAFTADNSIFFAKLQSAFSSVVSGVQGLFGHADFSPEEALASTPNIDPAFIPREPMNNANLDVHLLNMLGQRGLKRGKEITAKTHPEFYQAWLALCVRANLIPPPQLILAESKMVNALTVTREEVVITTGLLKSLDLRETCAVLGHELGHATSDHTTPRVIAMGTLAVPSATFGAYLGARSDNKKFLQRFENEAARRPGFLPSGMRKLFGSILGFEIGMVAANQLAVRPTELDADRKGAMISGDPEGLIAALTKLEAGHSKHPILHTVTWLQSGYPSTAKRIHNLQKIALSMPPHGSV